MAKIKKTTKSDTCGHALRPFGKSMPPLCSYGMKLSETTSIKDFRLCMNEGKCYKDEDEKKKEHQ